MEEQRERRRRAEKSNESWLALLATSVPLIFSERRHSVKAVMYYHKTSQEISASINAETSRPTDQGRKKEGLKKEHGRIGIGGITEAETGRLKWPC